MPSFTSAGAELRQLARVWRTGNLAFRELFDVIPKKEGEIYNKVALKSGAPAIYKIALEEVNSVWVTAQVSKSTRTRAQAIRKQSQELVAGGAPKKEATKQLKPLKKKLQERRRDLEQELTQNGGIMSGITQAKSSSDAAKAKALIVLSLGSYLEENKP